MITALALMIAVAGYFSYMNNNMEDGQVTAEASADAGTVQDTYDISELKCEMFDGGKRKYNFT